MPVLQRVARSLRSAPIPRSPLQVVAAYPNAHLVQLVYPRAVQVVLPLEQSLQYMQYLGAAFTALQAERLPNLHLLQVWGSAAAGRGARPAGSVLEPCYPCGSPSFHAMPCPSGLQHA